MLRALAILAALGGIARAEELHQPQKLTVALADDLLGELTPDERHLYFISNRNVTTQVFHLDTQAPPSALLFDESADVTGVRLSPDGKQLAYISFRDEATGQLCLRQLITPSSVSERRCLGEAGALEVLWRGPAELLLLTRGAVEGDLRVASVDVSRLRARPLLDANLTGPAVSPDGQWLVYVPVARAQGRIGPALSAQAARELAVRRLDGKAQSTVHFDLPGVSGQPAFAPDGRWLYFTQFLNDTDQNGVLDGDDRGVVFRAPFDRGALGAPEQITSGDWNCQYPRVSGSGVTLTCTRGGSLDIYRLPRAGMIPPAWSAARVAAELEASRDPWERLLLLRRLEGSAPDGAARAALRFEIIRIHFGLGEHAAALEHAKAIARMGTPEQAQLAALLPAWISERQAMHAFDHGEAGQSVLEGTRKRLAGLARAPAGETAAVAALRQIIASELDDDLGEKEQAVAALGRATVDDHTPAFVVLAKAARAEDLFRTLDRPADLVAALAPLVDHPSLPPIEKLRLGGIYARSVVRGLDAAHAAAAIANEHAAAGSVRAFWLELESCRAHLDRDCAFALYRNHPDVARRRTLVRELLRRAEDLDQSALEVELARTWAADVPHDSAERRFAERIYRHVAEDAGYAALAAGRLDEAAAEFETVTQKVESLESHIAYIEARLAAGQSLAEIERTYAARYGAESTSLHFARAYLGARGLHELEGEAFDRAYAGAFAEVQSVERALPQKCEVQALYGTLLHLRYLHRGDVASAQEASTHYLLALDLARQNVRYRAMVLEQLALLQSQVGNARLAVEYFEQRKSLPFASPVMELGHRLGYARAQLHAGNDAEAAKIARHALEFVEATPALTAYLRLALDRAALYTLDTGDGKAALALYDRLVPLSESTESSERPRNVLVHRLARAAAAQLAGQSERALADLDVVDRTLANPQTRPPLAWADAAPAEVARTYDLLRLGLRQQAELAVGRFGDARRDGAVRRDLLAVRATDRKLDDDLLALSRAELQLADLARRQSTPQEAALETRRALERADELAKKNAATQNEAQLHVLEFAAQAHLFGGIARTAFGFDLPARLRTALDGLAKSTDAKQRELRRRLTLYLTLLALD